MSVPFKSKLEIEGSGPPLSPLPPFPEKLKGGWRFALPAILALYLLFAVLHANLFPMGQRGYQNAPDEPAHLSYIEVVREGRLPSLKEPGPRAPSDLSYETYEWHQPPLYYVLATPFRIVSERAVRFLSILIGLGCITLIFEATRWLIPRQPMAAILAAGCAALTPGHIAITSVVNNDGLLEFFFSAWALAIIHSLNGGFTPVRARWVGVVIGGALLTKATAVLLLPLTAFTLFLMWRNGESKTNLIRGAAWVASVATCLSGWWFLRNLQLYHELLPLKAFLDSFGGTAQASDAVAGSLMPDVSGWGSYLVRVAEWTFKSFWSVYGTRQSAAIGAPRFLPAPLYQLAGVAMAVVAAGMTRLHLRRRQEFNQTQLYSLWILFAMLGLVGVVFAKFNLTYFQAQGRYFYPAMAPICVCISLGWRSVFPERYKTIASVFLLGFLCAFCVAFLRIL